MPENCVDSVVVDGPYGLEFMGEEWDTFGASIEATAKSAGGFGADAPTNENAYAAARVRHGKLWTERPAKKTARASGRNDYCDSARPVYTGGQIFQQWNEAWARAVYRVLKPGGYILAFGGTRTYHRLACGLEDAGFDIRDQIDWIYGSGFPKSQSVQRAIDMSLCELPGRHYEVNLPKPEKRRPDDHICPCTPEGSEWEGWGTALKPAHEPICVARKPFKTSTAFNVLAHRTGGVNVDGGRIGRDANDVPGWHKSGTQTATDGYLETGTFRTRNRTPEEQAERFTGKGRWPANVILSHTVNCVKVGTLQVGSGTFKGPTVRHRHGHKLTHGLSASKAPDNYGVEEIEAWECADNCPVRMLDSQSGTSKTPSKVTRGGSRNLDFRMQEQLDVDCYGDSGGASRFFQQIPCQDELSDGGLLAGSASNFMYCPKPSVRERDTGLSNFTEQQWHAWQTGNGASGKPSSISEGRNTKRKNIHPTVKPLALMRYLVRLVTPPGGIVLDNLCGSATTGVAAILEGMRFIGIEKKPEYWQLARARLTHAEDTAEENTADRQPAVLAKPRIRLRAPSNRA